MKNQDLIKKVNEIIKDFDSSAYCEEAHFLYPNKEGIIITNEELIYNFGLKYQNKKYKIYGLKYNKDTTSLINNEKFIPDYKKSLIFKNLNEALKKLYFTYEKEKIKQFMQRIKYQIKNKIINEKEFINLIIEEANKSYGILAYKEGNKFIFETGMSVMEIKKINLGSKRIYRVHLNNIFLFQFELFLEAIEKSFIKFIEFQMEKVKVRGERKEKSILKQKLYPDVNKI